jgi:hypothetical protein
MYVRGLENSMAFRNFNTEALTRMPKPKNSTSFDSIRVKFNNVKEWPSPLVNSRTVPFVQSYLEVIKNCIDEIKTEYFWIFPSFMHCKEIDFSYVPEQFEKEQIHTWYTTHPMGGLNKEGHVLLIPTKQFKEQIKDLKFLRDYKDINYHAHKDLWNPPVTRVPFPLRDPIDSYNKTEKQFYKWMVNKDLPKDKTKLPNFYPSFWEDEKLYTFGKTKDIMLVPCKDKIEQFYDFDRTVHIEYEYDVTPMDIIFISYDEPGAEQRYNKLKERFPRAQWCKGVKGQTQAYWAAAGMSKTDYFFAVFPKIDIVDTFNFDFQPDRLKNPCHYIFDCHNTVIDLTYGHDGVILYNTRLVIETLDPGLDFTLSKSHTSVPVLSAKHTMEETPLLAWRTAFRETLKLKAQSVVKPTVETNFRLKKWCTLGKGKNAEWVYKGAMDAIEFTKSRTGKDLKLSYDFDWLTKYFEEKYK